MRENKVGTTVVSRYDYSVNLLGQRTGVSTSGTAFPAAPGWAWQYDALGQVISADHSADNARDRAYQYDTIGNRIEARDGVTTPTGTPNHTSNALNQYSAINSLNPVHDDDGNLISGPLPANVNANSTLIWDAESTPFSPPTGPPQTLFHWLPAKSKFLATKGVDFSSSFSSFTK